MTAPSRGQHHPHMQMVLQQGLTAMPGLHKCLDALRDAGVQIAAVTNAPKANVAVMLHSLQLSTVFEVCMFQSVFEFYLVYLF